MRGPSARTVTGSSWRVRATDAPSQATAAADNTTSPAAASSEAATIGETRSPTPARSTFRSNSGSVQISSPFCSRSSRLPV
jgi:hypothetical protein